MGESRVEGAGDAMEQKEKGRLYHERQRRQFCLVHTLNALLQKPAFSPEALDEICYSLSESRWLNPHRSWLGLGNYDANVLMAALGLHDLQASLSDLSFTQTQTVWFDARTPVEGISWSEVHSLVFNIPSPSWIPFYAGRHWFGVLKLPDGRFVNLDSKLKEPQPVEDVVDFSKKTLEEKGAQLLIVTHLLPSTS